MGAGCAYRNLAKLLRCDWLGRSRLIITRAVPPFCDYHFWQWSLATPSQLFDWQVRYPNIYLFYVHDDGVVLSVQKW